MFVKGKRDKMVEIVVVDPVSIPYSGAPVDNVEVPGRISRAALWRNIPDGDMEIRIDSLYPFLCECSDGVELDSLYFLLS